MGNHFEEIIADFGKSETLIVNNRAFLNEVISYKSLQCSVVGTLIFFEIDFKNVDLLV